MKTQKRNFNNLFGRNNKYVLEKKYIYEIKNMKSIVLFLLILMFFNELFAGGPPPPPPPPPSQPSNDECVGAIPLTVNPDLSCAVFISGTLELATQSADPINCGGETGLNDVWYSFVATSIDNTVVSVRSVSGMSSPKISHALYTGTCGSLGSELGCQPDFYKLLSSPAENEGGIAGLTIGQTYYVRVWHPTGISGSFDICINTSTAPNDNCANATIIPANLINCTQTVSGNTAGTSFSYGDPKDCIGISMEDDIWFEFTAVATSVAISFLNKSTSFYWGLYNDTEDCGLKTSASIEGFCFFNDAPRTISGLTPGDTYYIRVASAPANNTTTGTFDLCVSVPAGLPITLVSFTGKNHFSKNELKWITSTEINNDFFTLERSKNGKEWETISIIKGAGNSNQLITYSEVDNTSYIGTSYYRLKQTDFDSKYEYSKTIAIKSEEEDLIIYPNPSSGNLFINVNTATNEVYTITYFNMLGAKHREQVMISENINTYQLKIFNKLESGIYFVKVINPNGKVINYKKIIKN